MTNADRIRSMTDEELAKLLDNSVEFFSCDECGKEIKAGEEACPDCEAEILAFLRKEYKEKTQ